MLSFYSLFFTTCLASNPAHCVQRQHLFNEAIATPQQCITVAQAAMAKWTADREHERWRVEAFRCGKPPRDAGRSI